MGSEMCIRDRPCKARVAAGSSRGNAAELADPKARSTKLHASADTIFEVGMMISAFVANVLGVWTGTDAQKSPGSQSTRISCAYDTLAAAVSAAAGASVVDRLALR